MPENDAENSNTRTVADLFIERVNIAPDKPALFWRNTGSAGTDDNWQSCTWNELATEVSHYSAVLQRLSIGQGSRVVLISENRREWIVADLAIQLLGAINVPLHSGLTSYQACELIEHCRPQMIFVSNPLQQMKIGKFADTIPVFVFDSAIDIDKQGVSQRWSTELARTPPLEFAMLANLAAQIKQEDLLSILYTSGTTGEPKGVMLTHKNVRANVFSKMATLPLGTNDVRLCFLPMTHIFARVCDIYTWLAAGCELWLSSGLEFLFDEMKQVRPTYLNGVPYFYEKCYRELEAIGRLDEPEALNNLLGGRTRICNCGGAPIADHVFDYFEQHHVGFVAGYGLTETSPVVTSCRPGKCKRGSVGPTIPGVEIKLAEDGEVLVRGDNVMKGYYNDDTATQNSIIDGWFYTGDVGQIDQDGHLFIIGRKKELIITSGAKKIAPIPIENQLNCHPAIDQSFVFGDRRDYLIALIVPDTRWLEHLEMNMAETHLRKIIDELLTDYSRYEQIGKFAILRDPFSLENGMLTPKRSLRRVMILERYREVIDALYER